MKALVVLVALITASFHSGVCVAVGGLGLFTREGERKGLGFSLGLIQGILFICLTGQAAVAVKIRAYNATGEVNIMTNNQIRGVAFTLGTRVLLTCDVTGLSEGSEVLSYKWYHNCGYERCEIREGDPYYRVVADTLLVDVTSENNVGRYNCHATYRNMEGESATARTHTTDITLAGECTCHKHENTLYTLTLCMNCRYYHCLPLHPHIPTL